MTPDYQSLLDFWLGPLDEGIADEAHRGRWFEPNPDFDDACARFRDWFELLDEGALQPWLADPRGSLAYILLADQLPRNLYRGTAKAFAWDARAREAALAGIKQGFDLQLGLDERSFFYLPFEHSEAIIDQHLAVGLFTALRDAAPKAHRSIAGNYLRYAQQHRDIILRFGRFPHRNGPLARAATPEETAYVADSDGFGQLTPADAPP